MMLHKCAWLLSDSRPVQFSLYFMKTSQGNVCLPSGSRSCGIPNSVSAKKKASCRFSRLGLLHTRSMSTRLGRRKWMTAKNAKPVRQLGPKSFTSSPKRLEKREHHKIRGDENIEGTQTIWLSCWKCHRKHCMLRICAFKSLKVSSILGGCLLDPSQ